MKNFFDEDGNNEVIERFFSRKPTDEQLDLREKALSRISSPVLKSYLKVIIAMGVFLALLFGVVPLVADKLEGTALLLFLIPIIVIFVIFFKIAYKMRINLFDSDSSEISPAEAEILASLSVPEDAFSVDAYYRDDEDKTLMPLTLLLYTEGPSLVIVEKYGDLSVYTVPNVTFTALKRVNEHAEIVFWEKAVIRLDESFEKYGITQTKNAVFCEYYYSLSILSDGEEYELFVAPYEKEKLSALTGISII